MTPIAPNQIEFSFNKFIGLSIAAHFALVMVFTTKMVFFPSEDMIIKSALRVDIVALPDKAVEPVAVPQPTPPPKPIVKPVEIKKPAPPKPITKPKPNAKARQSDAIDRLKALQAIDKIKAEVDQQEKKTEEKPVEYKGNIVTKGSDLKGLDKLQFDGYLSKIKKHIKDRWVVPQWLSETELRTQVLVKIDERGLVISREITISSGNVIFDNKAIEAVENSSPCPVAPDRLKTLVSTEGLIFNFP